MRSLFLALVLLTTQYRPMGQDPDLSLNDIVNVCYRAEVITEAIRNKLAGEVSIGRLKTADRLFLKMEALSFQTLPDSVKAYFSPNSYIGLPPHAHNIPGDQPVPAGHKVVVDYLYSKGILGENCKSLLDEYLFKSLYVLDLFIENGTLNHTFIQLLTKLDACNAQHRTN